MLKAEIQLVAQFCLVGLYLFICLLAGRWFWLFMASPTRFLPCGQVWFLVTLMYAYSGYWGYSTPNFFLLCSLLTFPAFGFPWSLSRDLSHLWLEPWLVSIYLVLWLVFLIWKDLWLFCSHLPLRLFQFEWAWQNPDRSRRLRDLHPKTKKESAFQFKFRIVSKMLRTAPWCRLPLTIRWLKQDYQQDFPVNANPPTHMPIVYGPVSVKTVKPGPLETQSQNGPEDPDDLPAFTQRSWTRCAVCCQKMTVSGMHLFQLLAECMATMLILMFQGEMVKISCSFFAKQIVEENTLRCLKPACRMVSHTLCLARHFLGADSTEVLPTEGQCPSCRSVLLWGDLIRFKAGCYQKMAQVCAAVRDVTYAHCLLVVVFF